MTRRSTMPSAASSRSRCGEHLGRDAGMSPRSSLKRRGPSRRYQTMFGVHAPPSNAMHSVSGHSVGRRLDSARAVFRTDGEPRFTSYQMATGSCLPMHQLVTYGDRHALYRRPAGRNPRQPPPGARRPIVQGPFGGGLSSVALAAAVSDAGGLGSFGVHHLEPAAIAAVAAELRAATRAPFALNLWVSDHDLPEAAMTPRALRRGGRAAAAALRRGRVSPRRRIPSASRPSFEEQAEAVLEARAGGVQLRLRRPRRARCSTPSASAASSPSEPPRPPTRPWRSTTPASTSIVASGAEAGGHRGAFLAAPRIRWSARCPWSAIAVERGPRAGDRRRRYRRRARRRRRARARRRGRADRHGVPRHRRVRHHARAPRAAARAAHGTRA